MTGDDFDEMVAKQAIAMDRTVLLTHGESKITASIAGLQCAVSHGCIHLFWDEDDVVVGRTVDVYIPLDRAIREVNAILVTLRAHGVIE